MFDICVESFVVKKQKKFCSWNNTLDEKWEPRFPQLKLFAQINKFWREQTA